eukprot:Amastigsp_a853007_47.p3 type:complete len:126 gc:universal Amastigsp_a853007_47:190-567(+)
MTNGASCENEISSLISFSLAWLNSLRGARSTAASTVHPRDVHRAAVASGLRLTIALSSVRLTVWNVASANDMAKPRMASSKPRQASIAALAGLVLRRAQNCAKWPVSRRSARSMSARNFSRSTRR